jgi:hypothetical protein
MSRQIASHLAASQTANARRIVANQYVRMTRLKLAGQSTVGAETSLEIFSALKLLEDQERKISKVNNAKRGETRKGRGRFKPGSPMRPRNRMRQIMQTGVSET